MARPDEIGSDLTLEIDGQAVTPAKFMKGARAFFAILDAATEKACGSRPKIQWVVQVKEGSNLLGVNPRPGYAQETIQKTYDLIEASVQALEKDVAEPDWLPRGVIRNLRDLGNIVGTDERDDIKVNVWVKRQPVGVTHKTVANAAERLKDAYTDHGSVEGKLSVVSERGSVHFIIYEPIWDEPIRCNVDDEQAQIALKHFGKRVEVYGEIKYRPDGSAISIRAEEIRPFPDAENIPSAKDVRGILRNYT